MSSAIFLEDISIIYFNVTCINEYSEDTTIYNGTVRVEGSNY